MPGLPIAPDVTPYLARAAIASISVLGTLQASPAVKAALADRVREALGARVLDLQPEPTLAQTGPTWPSARRFAHARERPIL